jgi:hypothetical protein
MAKIQLICPEHWAKKIIYIPKLVERSTDYGNKLIRKHHGSVRAAKRLSGQIPENVSLEKEEESEQEEESKNITLEKSSVKKRTPKKSTTPKKSKQDSDWHKAVELVDTTYKEKHGEKYDWGGGTKETGKQFGILKNIMRRLDKKLEAGKKEGKYPEDKTTLDLFTDGWLYANEPHVEDYKLTKNVITVPVFSSLLNHIYAAMNGNHFRAPPEKPKTLTDLMYQPDPKKIKKRAVEIEKSGILTEPDPTANDPIFDG